MKKIVVFAFFSISIVALAKNPYSSRLPDDPSDTCIEGCESDYKVDWNRPAFEACKAGCGKDFGQKNNQNEQDVEDQKIAFPACFKECQECMKKCSACFVQSK